MVTLRRVVFAFPFLAACATTQSPAQCPVAPAASVAVAAPAPTPAAPQGPPVSELLARVPRGSNVVVRLDVQRFFGTRLGRMVAPFMVWSREYARLREHCTERPWDELRVVEGAFRENATAAALLGPIADENNRCVAAVLNVPNSDSLRVRQAGGGAALVVGEDAVRPAMVAARTGEGNAAEDEAFRGLSAGMVSPIATVLVRGGAYRDAMEYLDTLQDEFGSRDSATPRLPRLELASREALQTLLGARLELGLNATGDLDMRVSMLFPSAADAERYTSTSRDDMRVRVPEYMARVMVRAMRENPDAPRAAQAFSTEFSSWLTELTPMEAHGPVVEYAFSGASSSMITVGALAAVAVPAVTRYEKRAKTAEATGNVARISAALLTQLGESPAARRRLGAIPATPSAAPGEARYPASAAAWATPAWRRLGFSIEGGHYYQYRVDVDGRCFVAVATGDLDGDGERSTFSRRVCPQPDGSYAASPISITNELE